MCPILTVTGQVTEVEVIQILQFARRRFKRTTEKTVLENLFKNALSKMKKYL